MLSPFCCITPSPVSVTYLRHVSPSLSSDPVTLSNGSLSDGSVAVDVPTTLIDTGSKHFSFIDPAFLKSSFPNLTPFRLASPVSLKLGDNVTTHDLTEYVDLRLTFPGLDARKIGTVRFYVFVTGYQIIVGLLDILRFYTDFLCTILRSASDDFRSSDAASLFALQFENSASPDSQLLEPWSVLDEIAPEDAIEAPRYTRLTYLSKAFSEHVADYHAILQSHVPNELVYCHPDIVQMLIGSDGRTPEFLHVFVPEVWPGMNPKFAPGLLPIHIEPLDTLPKYMKPPARPVSPKLKDAFDAEVTRFKTYLWVPYLGPHASPLVIASKKTPPWIRIAVDYRRINIHLGKIMVSIPFSRTHRRRCFSV